MDDTPDVGQLLSALRTGRNSDACTRAAQGVAALFVSPSQLHAREALCKQGVLPALGGVLSAHTLNRSAAAVPACCRAISALARGPGTPAATEALHSSGPEVVQRLTDLVSPRPVDAATTCALDALAALLTASHACREAAVACNCCVKLGDLVLGPNTTQGQPSEAASSAAQCAAELAQLGSGREGLRPSFPALTKAVQQAGLDTAPGAYACLALLRCAHDDGLRSMLHDGGRAAWTVLDTKCSSGVTGDPSPPSRPGGRLAAVLLIGLLFCHVKDGNPGAAKLLSRFEAPKHLAALLDAALAEQRAAQARDQDSHPARILPPGSFTAYGVPWSNAEVVLYSRFCSEHPALVTSMADYGTHAKLGSLLAAAAVSGTLPQHHPGLVFDATVASAACASRDLVTAAAREFRAAENAFSAAREMLEVPVSNAIASMCCSAQPHDGGGGAHGDDSGDEGAAGAVVRAR